MKACPFIFLFLLLKLVIYAQTKDRTDCERMYLQAQESADSGRYEMALNKLAAAKICNPAETKYDSEIIKIYKDINRQKEIAIEAKKLETEAKDEAVRQ